MEVLDRVRNLTIGIAIGVIVGLTAAWAFGRRESTAAGDAVPSMTAKDGLLRVEREIDGDSFVASDGVEYRVGMVDTPELADCGGSDASNVTYAYLDGGFSVEVYAKDDFGRSVARVSTSEGDLGVMLATTGYADDRYLDRLRSQHPVYAAELDDGFSTARTGRAGLYQTCWAAGEQAAGLPTPAPPDVEHTGRVNAWNCHPAYRECLPDGADLDCADVGHSVALLSGLDPFRLDGNSEMASDGVGCETFEPWQRELDYAYYESATDSR